MKRLIARRPTPATAIACLALFVALGGVSYGFSTGSIDSREIRDNTIQSKDVRRATVNSSDLRDNSIRTDDLRNNEVRGRDIRNSTIRGIEVALNSLTGADVAEETFALVPNADTLDGVDSTGFLRSDPTGAAGIALGATWVGAAGATAPHFNVDAEGYVHLSGEVAKGAGAGPVLGVLPPEARPGAVRRFTVVNVSVSGAEVAPIAVEPDGEIRPTPDAEPGDRFSLDEVVFRAGG